MVSIDSIIAAAHVPPHIPEIKFGLWSFWRVAAPGAGVQEIWGVDNLAILGRISWLTVHQDEYEIVMEDSNPELRRHLPIFRHGRGRVLVSGLGLGCVVRGLLAKPEVEHIDVVEIDREIIDHFGAEFAGDSRVTVHYGDALKYRWPRGTRWDVAWHDIVCVKGDGLLFQHLRLVRRFYGRCKKQGWWGTGARVARRAAPGYIIAA
jgi:spermidine synthase